MAYAFVQKGSGLFSETITWTGATGAGNLLAVVLVKANNSGEFVTSLAGNVNASQPGWASAQGTINTIGSKIVTGSSYADFGSATLLYLPGTANAGGDTTTTVTIHSDGGGNIWVGAMEFSGIIGATPFINYQLGAQTTPGGGTDAVTSGTVNVSTVPALLAGFGIFNAQLGSSSGTGTGFAGRGLDAPSNPYMWGEDRRITSISNVACTFTQVTNSTTIAIGMAFAEGTVAPPPVLPFGPMPKQVYIMP
jgi:hypothetical protein